MTGPLRVGMPNQPHPMGVHPGMPPPHHGAMDQSGMGMGRMVPHQTPHMGPGGMGQVQMAGGHQYMHPQPPGGHHQGMHPMARHHQGMHPMPRQQMGGMGHMMTWASPHGHMPSNMIHHGNQPHMVNMHSPNARFGNTIRSMPNPAGGAVMMQDNSQLAGGGAGMGGTANPLQNMSPSQQQRLAQQQAPPHSNFGMTQPHATGPPAPLQPASSAQQQAQAQQQQQAASAASQGQGVGAANAMPSKLGVSQLL